MDPSPERIVDAERQKNDKRQVEFYKAKGKLPPFGMNGGSAAEEPTPYLDQEVMSRESSARIDLIQRQISNNHGYSDRRDDPETGGFEPGSMLKQNGECERQAGRRRNNSFGQEGTPQRDSRDQISTRTAVVILQSRYTPQHEKNKKTEWYIEQSRVANLNEVVCQKQNHPAQESIRSIFDFPTEKEGCEHCAERTQGAKKPCRAVSSAQNDENGRLRPHDERRMFGKPVMIVRSISWVEPVAVLGHVSGDDRIGGGVKVDTVLTNAKRQVYYCGESK